MSNDGARREEVLETAAALFASSGLRTSLGEIAEACGILPGSLYHHFDSKAAIVVELVHRYRNDLDMAAKEAMNNLRQPPQPVEDRVVALGRSIASCALRHRAALLLTLYDPPTVLGEELAQLGREAPAEIKAAMVETLRDGRASGEIRPVIDLDQFGDRLCQSMLHVGVGVSHVTPGAHHVPELRMAIQLHGIGVETPSNAELDRSPALRAARDYIGTWVDPFGAEDRRARLQAAARREFGRRGYESTTMRDIGAAAGLSTGAVYRTFQSKEQLLVSIMSSYAQHVKAPWEAVLQSPSTPLEKLDALLWVNIQILDRFSDEFRIQLAWLRQNPPSSPNLDFSFSAHLHQLRTLLSEGSRSGEIRLEGASADVGARCVFEAIVTSPNVVRAVGVDAAHALARDTVLRGAMVHPRSSGRQAPRRSWART